MGSSSCSSDYKGCGLEGGFYCDPVKGDTWCRSGYYCPEGSPDAFPCPVDTISPMLSTVEENCIELSEIEKPEMEEAKDGYDWSEAGKTTLVKIIDVVAVSAAVAGHEEVAIAADLVGWALEMFWPKEDERNEMMRAVQTYVQQYVQSAFNEAYYTQLRDHISSIASATADYNSVPYGSLEKATRAGILISAIDNVREELTGAYADKYGGDKSGLLAFLINVGTSDILMELELYSNYRYIYSEFLSDGTMDPARVQNRNSHLDSMKAKVKLYQGYLVDVIAAVKAARRSKFSCTGRADADSGMLDLDCYTFSVRKFVHISTSPQSYF